MASRRTSWWWWEGRGVHHWPGPLELLASSVEQGKDGSPHVIPVPGREHLTPARVLIYSKQAFWLRAIFRPVSLTSGRKNNTGVVLIV